MAKSHLSQGRTVQETYSSLPVISGVSIARISRSAMNVLERASPSMNSWIFFALHDMGPHNINLVSPTPYVPFIVAAIERAREEGLRIPFVYNTHAYETVDTLRMLDGLIDIYLPDFKYWSGDIANRLSCAKDYPRVCPGVPFLK
ncbi:MAG: hypothetical protein MZV70_61885 [Desulfobacterales bacterium]|nr:hypothetical protein [Desulfobacterales bacterium]